MKRLIVPTVLTLTTHIASFAGDSSSSPFAGEPCDSYSNFTDEDGKPGVLLWGKAPLVDFGSREVKFDTTGVRKLNPVPSPGVHPRIFFGRDDLAAVRKRVKETRCGREAWKNILSWTEMMKGTYDDKADYAQPDRWNGSFGGLHGRVPLFRLGIPREKGFAYNQHPKAAAIYKSLADGTATEFPPFYWNTMSLEAFRCLIDNDRKGGETLAKAVLTAMKLDQAKRDVERAALQAKNPDRPLPPPAQPVGAFQLAFCYDFLFNWLIPAQKKAIHDELAATTWSHDNYGTFNTAESSRSNWATFSYWLFEVLAIEGEPGFNDLKVRGMYRGWRNLLTYGWFQSGATFEGEAKNQLGMDGIIPFTIRAAQYGFDNLSGHPYLQAYVRSFLPHSSNAMLTGFHKYDLLGGSRAMSGGANTTDSLGLKFMFPEDRVIDWCYRQAIKEDYSGVPDRPDGYYNALLFCAVYASDFDPSNSDPKQFHLGNTFFCGERALMMTRSSWDKEATQLNMHTRQMNGGHPFSDRNAVMIAGAGRIWSPNGYATFRTQENSVVCIDGKSQSEIVPGRCVDFVDQPAATFMVGDAKYCWDWNWKRLEKKRGDYTMEDVRGKRVDVPAGWEPVLQTPNDFAYTKLPFAYLNRPAFEYAHWIHPNGALSPYVRQPNYPVQRAFRTAGLVRGAHPYVIVVDDIQKDDSTHHYDWTLGLEYDIQIEKVQKHNDRELEIRLTGSDPDQVQKRSQEPIPSELAADTKIPEGQPMLLVHVLNCPPSDPKLSADTKILELPNVADPKKYSRIRRLVIPCDAVSPDYKVLLFPYRNGAPLPKIQWKDKQTVMVEWSDQKDAITFTPSDSKKTNIELARDGKTLVSVNHPVKPLD